MEKSRMEEDSYTPLEMQEGSVPKLLAIAACTAMAVFYVAVLYSPTLVPRLAPPTSLKSFMIRRFVCAGVSSVVSIFASALILFPMRNSWTASTILGVYGIRVDHLWQAVIFPLSLTSLLYFGSLLSKSLVLVGAWKDKKFHRRASFSCIKNYPQGLLDQLQWILSDVLAWRVYLVAPVTEEVVFRACMIPLLLCGAFKASTIVFLCPISFSLAHLNHLLELYWQQNYSFMTAALSVAPQLGYTVIFGVYASFLFIRTGSARYWLIVRTAVRTILTVLHYCSNGHLLAPIVAHMFCNVMGLPVFWSAQRKGITIFAFLAGVISFMWLLFPATSPRLYNDRTDDCRCWHGYCSWT